MSITDLLFGRAETEDIGSFDANEGKDLELHVRQCGRRFRALDRKLDVVIRLLVVFFIAMVVNVPGALKLLLAMVQ